MELLAEPQGWGSFPMEPERVLLGNGWDESAARYDMRWARLTGAIALQFAWQYAPDDPEELIATLWFRHLLTPQPCVDGS